MRLSLVIYFPDLAAGGAERQSLHLAPDLMAGGFDVTFLVHRIRGPLVAAVPPGVRLAALECDRTLAALGPLIRFLRAERPDILLANFGQNNLLAIAAAALARVPTRVVATQHNALSAECGAMGSWSFRALPRLCRWFLGRADAVVAVSEGVADDLVRTTGIGRDRIRVIPNPVITADFERRREESADHPWLAGGGPPVILGIGRLVEQKDFATLIAAFAGVVSRRAARLIILGEGPLRASLMAHAGALGVADHVSLPGYQPNPLPFLRAAAVLVLSSRFEGFGNVLVEALAVGTPVVSTDCPYGPAEILDQGRFGRLVPVGDPEAMAGAILETLDHPPPPEELRRRGRAYTVAAAAARYGALFRGLVAARPESAVAGDPAGRPAARSGDR